MTEGERWVRDALADLRDHGSPVTFLRASQRRAAATRRQRPRLTRQARAWSAAGAAAWVLPPLRPRARAGLAWWAAVALMLDWHLGMVETEDGEPRMLGLADASTLLRAWLVPLAAHDPRASVIALGLATDAADGALARRSGPTRAGRDLEGLVDTAFTGAALHGLVRRGRLGRAPAAVEVARLAAGFAYALIAYFGAGRPPQRSFSRAARASAPLRAAGLLAAAAGSRRAGEALLALGSVSAVARLAAEAFPPGLQSEYG